MDEEILVVGAGPTGLTMGLLLAEQGIRVRVVDRAAGPTQQSRALVVQARTLELWSKLGLAEAAIGAGQPVGGAYGILDGKVLHHGEPLFDFREIGRGQTPYPFLLVFEQNKTERMLLGRLRSAGQDVYWRTEAVSLHQHDDHVEVVLRGPGGEEVVTPRWVVGADGASSMVRHALGLSFEGDTYEQQFFLADVAMDWDLGHDELYLAQSAEATLLFVPMRVEPGEAQRFRILASATPEVAGRDDLTLKDVQHVLDVHSGIKATVSDPRWISLYRLHHRMAPRFRQGRVFLAGDAGHIHSPIGGQGMNTGIQDAWNLAWKLALVAGGHAHVNLLDSYEAERQPVARALVHGTDTAFGALVADKTLARLARREVAHLLPTALDMLPTVRRHLFAAVSQIAISYQDSPAVAGVAGRHQDGPLPGDRAPHAVLESGAHAGRSVLELFSGGGHHLLLLPSADSGDQAATVTRWVEAATLPMTVHLIDPANRALRDAYGAQEPTMVLIRPDGYLGWRGALADTAALAGYLDRWFTPSS